MGAPQRPSLRYTRGLGSSGTDSQKCLPVKKKIDQSSKVRSNDKKGDDYFTSKLHSLDVPRLPSSFSYCPSGSSERVQGPICFSTDEVLDYNSAGWV